MEFNEFNYCKTVINKFIGVFNHYYYHKKVICYFWILWVYFLSRKILYLSINIYQYVTLNVFGFNLNS